MVRYDWCLPVTIDPYKLWQQIYGHKSEHPSPPILSNVLHIISVSDVFDLSGDVTRRSMYAIYAYIGVVPEGSMYAIYASPESMECMGSPFSVRSCRVSVRSSGAPPDRSVSPFPPPGSSAPLRGSGRAARWT